MTEFQKERKTAIRVASQLCYPPSVIAKLHKATNGIQLGQIMAAARANSSEKESNKTPATRPLRGKK